MFDKIGATYVPKLQAATLNGTDAETLTMKIKEPVQKKTRH